MQNRLLIIPERRSGDGQFLGAVFARQRAIIREQQMANWHNNNESPRDNCTSFAFIMLYINK